MTVADELSGVASATYWTNKATVAAVKGTHRKAQEYGMRYQNWRHKGAGEEAGSVVPADAVNDVDAVKNRTDRPRTKSWTTDEESFENTTTSHTTYTRKRTR